MALICLHLDVASNFSDFFFRFHFHGLNSLPSAENLLTVAAVCIGFLSTCVEDVRVVADPKLFVRIAAPFCFLPVNKKYKIKRVNFYANSIVELIQYAKMIRRFKWKTKKNFRRRYRGERGECDFTTTENRLNAGIG